MKSLAESIEDRVFAEPGAEVVKLREVPAYVRTEKRLDELLKKAGINLLKHSEIEQTMIELEMIASREYFLAGLRDGFAMRDLIKGGKTFDELLEPLTFPANQEPPVYMIDSSNKEFDTVFDKTVSYYTGDLICFNGKYRQDILNGRELVKPYGAYLRLMVQEGRYKVIHIPDSPGAGNEAAVKDA